MNQTHPIPVQFPSAYTGPQPHPNADLCLLESVLDPDPLSAGKE